MVEATQAQDAAERRKARAIRLIREMQNRTQENGCSEAEALEAADKIGAMMRQFDLELSDVTARDVSDMTQIEVYAPDNAAGSILVGIGKLCSLQVYRDTKQTTVVAYVMFGHAPDVELATYLYEVCDEAIDNDWQKDMNAHGYSKKKRESFRAGFAHRVHARMSQMRKERDDAAAAMARQSNCTDLVVLKDQIVEAEFAKTGVKLTSSRRTVSYDNATYLRGHMAGDRVNLNNPLRDMRGAMTPVE